VQRAREEGGGGSKSEGGRGKGGNVTHLEARVAFVSCIRTAIVVSQNDFPAWFIHYVPNLKRNVNRRGGEGWGGEQGSRPELRIEERRW
jgi:hypothetical protein